ncbi:hypothetical protein ACS0TY_020385 [Phlomoides rotata]
MMGTVEKNMQLNDGITSCETQDDASIPEMENSPGMTGETSQGKQWRKPNLFLEIPTRPLEVSPQELIQINTPTPKRVNFFLTPSPSASLLNESSGPSSTRGISSIRSLLPKLSFKNWRSNSDVDKSANLQDSSSSNVVTQDKLSITRSWSFSKIFTPRIKRTSSLPLTEIANSNSGSAHGGSVNSYLTVDVKEVRPISRSISLPVISKEKKSLQKMNSFFRVIPSTPRTKVEDSQVSTATSGDDENNEADGEDIPEEEAVCRICLVELCEGGETLKMECSCKGELALAHQECAVKWFAIKGNTTCEVCKQQVLNLPVTLIRVQSSINRNTRPANITLLEFNGYSVWQELPILVIVAMLAYFCFLEQLLVKKLDTSAIAISLPFSCVLGLLSTMTSSAMVKRRYVWVYATTQFVLVVLFAHIFYNVIHVQAVISILLSTFAGFGLAMSGASIVAEFIRWRERHRSVSQSISTQAPPPPPSRSPRRRGDGTGNPLTLSRSQ